ncbi:DUF421 domain-containing protein [Caldalkalibacillus salinus]|uniref:DUF421 domain-containing protein n=1 Tax=Caldalkalibacillus salinus TaxID=2803787 RepID=UPI0019237AB6|nr:YetF domain-containing protein [Caldalkalibacillus salinus]
MDFVWESIVLVLTGFILLRFAGRKSISQMTVATTVIMISIGSIIIQPIIEKSVLRTMGATAIFILILILVEYFEMKFNGLEKMLTGKSKVVIENGQLNVDTLRQLRLTVDKLEMQLRSKGITNLSQVKTVTIEANGQIGYELNDDEKPLTVGEFKKMLGAIQPMNASAGNAGQAIPTTQLNQAQQQNPTQQNQQQQTQSQQNQTQQDQSSSSQQNDVQEEKQTVDGKNIFSEVKQVQNNTGDNSKSNNSSAHPKTLK